MNIDDIGRAQELARERADLIRCIAAMEKATQITVPFYAADKEWRVNLQDYDTPSNIGATFREVKAAMIAMKEKQLDGINEALLALNVTIE